MKMPQTLNFLSVLLLLVASSVSVSGPEPPAINPAAPQAIQAPVLKWQRGGCDSVECKTGYYSSPAVADVDNDGKVEVIAAADLLSVLGDTGTLTPTLKWWQDPLGLGVWPGVVVADIDGNGALEIVTAHGGGYVHVYDYKVDHPRWSQRPTPGQELRSLAAYDLEGDGKLEILVAAAIAGNHDQWHVYQFDGTPRAGWPQLAEGAPGNAAGCFNENIAVADLDRDERGEIIGPSNAYTITAYQDDGSQISANSRYDSAVPVEPKFWSQVGVHVSDAVDLRGYANCGTEHRANFADSAPLIADVNRDGTLEVVVVGNVYNCKTYTDLYQMPFIFNADRSRWKTSGFDWTAIPVPDGKAAPLSESDSVIESAMPNPVAADLDSDGNLEILYASYDGRVHAYWLDKTEHGSWPYSVYSAADGFFSFASEPVVADLDNNGKAEVIFASWTQKGSGHTGKLYILDYLGNPLHIVNLPPAFGVPTPTWNGVLAAPTLADIDGDGNLDVVLNTAHSGVVAYKLPGTSQARILWGTGRGNYQRTGSFVRSSLEGSAKIVQPILPEFGDTLFYTIRLYNPGPAMSGVHVTDTLPSEVSYLGDLWASAGSYNQADGIITWSGTVSASVPINITFSVTVSKQSTAAYAIVNTALINDGRGVEWSRQATAFVNGYTVYLPLIRRGQ
jgi:uncharacterized repeat protein (TIGR01451 family)